MSEIRWYEVEKDGFPKEKGAYICIVRGATSLRLMRYVADRGGWIGIGIAGGVNKSVTHWCKTPEPPKALWMNVLIKKASNEGLDDDEKLELANLLTDSTK